jgi:serine/threonine-protein kinase HipA
MTTSDPAAIGERGERECFVYIQLPASLEVVTCGRFVQQVTPGGATVGRFVYGRRYRARPDAVPLDAFHLPISARTYETARLGGIFGALRDASPDAWGRMVIDRELGRTDVTEVEYLLHSPEDRAGALSFGRDPDPPAPQWRFNGIVQLADLMEAARLLEEQTGTTFSPRLRQMTRLLEPGTSLGGARPKNVVEDADGLWVAKFPHRGDRWNAAVVEAAMLSLARRCGIETPTTRIEHVGGQSVLLVKRFDREQAPQDDAGRGYRRHRMVSALTVLDADDTGTDLRNWSYPILADELRRWSHRAAADRVELFRRMVFNALISNNDDHPRNHAIIAPAREWQLAPAYDLTPDPMPGSHERHLAMVCGRHGRMARRANLVSDAPRFSLTPAEANAVIETMVEMVRAGWERAVQDQGGTAGDREAIAPAFVDEGFDYPI